jgi:hypothetical protein
MRTGTIGLILCFALSSTTLLAQSKAADVSEVCQVHALPSFVQNYLLQHEGTWRIQESKDLGPRTRERWKAEKPSQCPGIASGLFDNTKELSYAILLVPVGRDIPGYKLIVFNSEGSKHSYFVRVVDESKDANSTAFFIHTIRIGAFFDPQSKKKFNVQAQEGILLIDAGNREYEADVYFWTAGSYHCQPIDC